MRRNQRINGSAIIFLILYVDDIFLIENNISMLTIVKMWLSKEFFLKDLGEAFFILGIKVYRDRPNRMLGLSQKMYIEKVLKRFSMKKSKKNWCPSDIAFISPRRCVPTYLRRLNA